MPDRPPTSRLPRAARREQILDAATAAFAAGGFAGTGLADVADRAGVTRVILYRHFDSKADLYRAVLGRAQQRLAEAVGGPDYTEQIIEDLLRAASQDPAAFRLLFHHAAREQEFTAEWERYRLEMSATALQQLGPTISDPAWARWAAQLVPSVTVAAITAWLDAGQPDRAGAAARIRQAVVGVVDAARRSTSR